jgi:PAT family beta-lactamase induction signal transducer AmpG
MAASMVVGMVTALWTKEPMTQASQDAFEARRKRALELMSRKGWSPAVSRLVAWLQDAMINPFADFLRRYGKQALLILALIGLYRISYYTMGVMANPFYVDMGYTKTEIAQIVKVFGVVMSIVGAFAGGALVMRFGIMRMLMVGAILSPASNLLFAWLSTQGHTYWGLVAVICIDNFNEGIAGSVFLAFLSSLTNVSYTATQYALFSSLMPLVPKLVAGYSGVYVNHFGYTQFFITSALIGLPVLVLVWLASRVQERA